MRNDGPNCTETTEVGSKLRVLFFSRGRGRGHAIPDIAIVDELPPNVDVEFVSYSTGAQVFRDYGREVIDLGFSDSNPFLGTLIRAVSVIAVKRPMAIISHEEFSVLPAASIAGIPIVFLTDWFPRPDHALAESLLYADSIIVMGEKGIFPKPPSIRVDPLYVDPVVRKMRYTLCDRYRARAELAIPEETLVVSVIPGAWAHERRAPMTDLILRAFDELGDKRRKRLIWVAGVDQESICQRVGGRPDVSVVGECPQIEMVMVVSDVAITKGNRGTILDLSSLGVPSISLSNGANPIDEILVARIRSNVALNVNAVDPGTLSTLIWDLACIRANERERPLELHRVGGETAARVLNQELSRLLVRPTIMR